MTIDAHHHFWKYNPEEYPWIGGRMRHLQRDFLPEHLKMETDRAGIGGVVSVQARQTVAETAWLLDLADANDFIRGVVGWVPLVSPRVGDDLARFAPNPKLKAVRHVLQDEPDDQLMEHDGFNAGIRALREFGLRYDILIFERHLPAAIAFVDRHPDQIFILDHVAKPKIEAGELSPWRENIRALAERPNVFCKISGMATEAAWETWSEPMLKPYLDTVLEAFTPRRLMFGSDWPVCLAATEYGRWRRAVGDYIRPLSADEQARILGGTAAEAYGLRA